ncbi:FecR family protein [Chitinophaga sp. XS-30]|uniref:FecR family protein n=1 Tax=Chitinophaga sp. XS-30 TaxID=2604421 RepID=UPI0011DDB76E|nr:FecR family protein [Chitinophaga sp. XS-30]QEH39542.1 FecR family protein [Chitinophaga sp. XS-30]
MQRMSYLILRHLRQELSAPEREELQHWIDVSEENRAFFVQCTDEGRLRTQLQIFGKTNTDEGWKRFSATHELPEARVLRMDNRKWMAAAVVLVLAIAGVHLLLRRSPVPQPVAVQQQDVLPGSSRAMLTLADGTEVPLDSAGSQVIAPGIIRQGGQLQYGTTNTVTSYNTLTTPRGGQFRLTLPDGTKVWLNAASSLRYPTAFSGRERKVEVTGEAYFEVTRNASSPFRVTAGAGTTVEVLGTKFNINAYTNENSLNTTLLEGAVRVSAGGRSATLKPGEQAQVLPSGEIGVVADINLDATVAWKNELFNFRDADIHTVMRQLERWYDVEVEFAAGIPERRFQGEIQRNLPLSDVLEGLKNTGIRFSIEGRKIVVRP